MLQSIQHKALEQLLVRHPDLDRVPGRTVLAIPRLHKGDIQGTPASAGPQVEGAWCPQQADPIRGVVCV